MIHINVNNELYQRWSSWSTLILITLINLGDSSQWCPQWRPNKKISILRLIIDCLIDWSIAFIANQSSLSSLHVFASLVTISFNDCLISKSRILRVLLVLSIILSWCRMFPALLISIIHLQYLLRQEVRNITTNKIIYLITSMLRYISSLQSMKSINQSVN